MRAPDESGPFASAWRMEKDAEAQDGVASMANWVVNAPSWHPAWAWWTVGLVHLRPVEGAPEAVKHYPEAEFEIIVLSLDPEVTPNVDLPIPQGLKYLTPPDLVFQFHGITDEQAVEIVEVLVKTAVEKNVPLDSDLRQFWTDSLTQTVAHYQQGVH